MAFTMPTLDEAMAHATNGIAKVGEYAGAAARNFSELGHGIDFASVPRFSSFAKAGIYGAAAGVGLAGAGWLASKAFPGDVGTSSIGHAAMAGGLYGGLGYAAFQGLRALNTSQELVKSTSMIGSIARNVGGRYSAIGLGLLAGGMAVKSIVSLNMTKSR